MFTSADFRFTYKDGFLYAFQMKPDKKALIRALAKQGHHDFLIGNVSLLGYEGEVSFERTEKGLEIVLPEGVCTDMPVCYKIEIG